MKAYSNKNIEKFGSGWSSILLFIVLIFAFAACGGSRSAEEQEEYGKLMNMVNNQSFEIENEWVNPLRGGMISLIGNPNYLKFSKDSVDIFLPYFGVRQIGGGYGNSQGGIVYSGEPKDLKIITSEKKKNILVKFSGQQGSENLNFLIELYPDGGANTSVSSSQRDAISYRGDFDVLPEKQKQQVDILLNRQN